MTNPFVGNALRDSLPKSPPSNPFSGNGVREGGRTHIQLPPQEEARFRAWYSEWAQRADLDPNPDNPLHKYDYRAAFRAGVTPVVDSGDGLLHWPSQFKDDDHPNRFVSGVGDTKALDQSGARQRSHLTVVTDRARKENPDAMAESFALRDRTGLPVDTIYRNLDQVRAQVGDRTFDPDTFLTRHPATGAWLQDPNNAAVSKDDWANLGTMERLVGRDWRVVQTPLGAIPIPVTPGVVAEEFRRGWLGLQRARLLGRTGAGWEQNPDVRAEYDRLKAAEDAIAVRLPERQGGLETLLRATAGSVAPSMAMVLGEGTAEGLAIATTAGGFAALAGPGSVVTVPAATTAGFAVGRVIGGVNAAREMMAGASLERLSEIRDENGQPLSPIVQDVVSQTVGTLGAGLEYVGFGRVVRPFDDAVARGLGLGAARVFNSPTARTVALRAAREYGAQIGTEVTTEVAQQALDLAGEEWARAAGNLQGGSFAPSDRDVVGELVSTATETALGMALLPIPGVGITILHDAARVKEAGEARDRMLALGESVEASKLRERAPEQFKLLLQQQIERNGAVRDVFIPVERFTEYWQKQGVDVAQVASELGLGDQYAAAVETGGDVVIPLATYATHIAPTEHHAALLDDLRLRPGALTAREAKELDKTVETEATKLREELTTAKPENDAEQRIVDDVVAQLTVAAQSMPAKTRYTPEQIATMAEGIARPYLALARQSGQDAFALYQRKNLKVVGPEVAESLFDAAAAPVLQAARVTGDELNTFFASEAREMTASGMTTTEIARELGVAESRVSGWVSGPAPEVTPEALRAIGLRVAFAQRQVLQQAAFHGTPHTFDRFDLSKIGTGEGAQAYGWGLPERDVLPSSDLLPSGDVPTTGNEGLSDVERNGVENLAKTLVSDPAIVQDASGFDVVTGRNVLPMVRGLLQNPQVLDAVVRLVPVEVVNVLAGEELSSEMLLDNPAMLVDLLPADIDDAVASRVQAVGALAYGVASAATEVALGAGNGFLTTDALRTANSTGDFRHSASKVTQTFLSRNGEPVTAQERADFLEQAQYVPGRGIILDEGEGFVQWTNSPTRPWRVFTASGQLPRGYDTAEQALAALKKAGLREAQPPTLKQGSDRPNAFLALGVSEDTIGLMRTANLSSVLHEFSHDWLNLLADLGTAPDATPEIQAEWQTVMKALNITSRDQLGTAEQEHWARAFEKYLADGQAPTRELARLFARFKAWMRSVYQAALDAFAPVSPELRGVFDRMFAADQAATEALNDTESLVESAEQAGMTDAEFAAHTQARADAKERTDAALLAQMLAETDPERRKGWKERKAALEAEVRVEVEARPVQQAVAWLRAKTTPTDGKPSKAMLVARYGPDVTKTLPRGTFTVDGGIDPDLLAYSVGLDSGDTLVTQLQAWEPVEAIVGREVDRRLKAEFPDLVNDSLALADEAQRQAHLGVNDDLILNELKALGRSDASVPAPNIKAVKRVAAELVDNTRVRDLQPHRYLLAERKANRLAKEALRKGDTARAAFHGRQQLLNHIAHRYATKAQAMEQRALKFFSRMSKDGMREKLGLAGQPYLEAMDGILNDYEFVRLSNVALGRRDRLNAWLAKSVEEGLPVEVPPAVLEDAAQRNYRTLTVGQLQGVYNTGKQIHTTATNKGKLLDAKRKRDAEATERAIVETIAAHHELQPRARDWSPERFKWVKGVAEKFDAWHTKPEFLFTYLDGEERDGAVWRNLFLPIAEAESAEGKMLREMVPQLEAVFAMVPAETRKAWGQRRVRVGNTVMTGEQVFAMALNWGNEGNRNALLESQVDGRPEWSLADLEAALGTLTTAEWRAVEAAWKLVDSYWPEISALQQRLVGVAPEKVEALPFTVTTADGEQIEVTGGYYPLSYDRKYSWAQEKIEQKRDVQEMGEWGYTRAATRHGHTEARVGSGGKPVKLDLSVLGEHLLNVIHDLTHREAVINTQRLLERDGVRTAIIQAAGNEMYATLAPWLKRVAADRLPPASPIESLIGRARRGATVVNMGLKVTTAIVQPLGYLQTVDFLGIKYARKGMTGFLKDPRGVWDFVQTNSDAMQGRRTSFDREARDLLKAQTGQTDWQGQVAQASMFFTGLADMSVSVPTWYGAYLKEMDRTGDHAKAVQAGDQAVRMTQGAGTAKDLARIQGGGETQRLFTMFYSYFSVLYNQMQRSRRMVGGPRDVPRFLGSMALLWFLPAVLSELVAQRGPEDDEDWGEWAAWELARYPLSSVVGVRDIASAVGPESYGFELSPVAQAIRSLPNAVNALGDVASGEEMTRADTKKVVEAIGYWGQLPTRQGWITGTYLYDWMMGYTTPEGPVEATRNLLFTRPRD